MKYIKLFEAFESNILSKTLSYVNDKQKFFNEIKDICHRYDFPLSKLSDNYFKYLPFKTAFEYNEQKYKRCKANSVDIWGKNGVDGEVCEKGRIKRRWGNGIRNVECPECGGSGKEPTMYKISLYKFWFNEEGYLLGKSYLHTNSSDNFVKNRYGNVTTMTSTTFKDAQFAIIFDMSLLDTDSNNYSVSKVRDERAESRAGALSLMDEKAIRKMNFERYISFLINKYDIEGISDLKTLYLRSLPKKYSVFYIKDVCTAGFYIIDNLYECLKYKKLVNDSDNEGDIRDYKYYYDNNRDNLIRKVKSLLNNSLKYKDEYDKFVQLGGNQYEFSDKVSEEINALVQRTDMDSIEAFEVLNSKLGMVRSWIGDDDFYYYTKRYLNYYPDNGASFTLPDKSKQDRIIKMIRKL